MIKGPPSYVDQLIGRIEHKDAANDNASPAASYRVVIEDETTGQEFVGWSGISRERAETIADFVNRRGVADVKIGRMPRRPFLFGRLARGRK